MKNIMYSYRLTYFGGTAPCYDGNFLSFAICKPAVRRTIGRKFLEDHTSRSFWLVGIAGASLCYSGDIKGEADKILYVAKVDDVKTYADYFSTVGKKRRADQIYVQKEGGRFIDRTKDGQELFFVHISEADDVPDCPPEIKAVHNNDDNMKNDWSLPKEAESQAINREKYVLISKNYTFLSNEQSKEFKEKLEEFKEKYGDNLLAQGRAHRVVDGIPDDFAAYLETLISSNSDHGTDNLPLKLQKGGCTGCGRKNQSKFTEGSNR